MDNNFSKIPTSPSIPSYQPVEGKSTVKQTTTKPQTPSSQKISQLKLQQQITGSQLQSESSNLTSKTITSPKQIETQSTTAESTVKTESTKPVSTYPKTLEEKQALCDKFCVGDVVTTRVTGLRKVEAVDPWIVILQLIAKFFGRSNKGVDHSVVHVAVVVGIDREKGQVIISEAMPSRTGGLRTVDLFSHNSCILEKGASYSYQVMRPTTAYAETAGKATQIALRVAPKASYLQTPQEKEVQEQSAKSGKKLSKFSFALALKGMFRRHDNFDIDAQKRVFKGIFDEHVRSTALTGGKQPRKVFCSAFGAQIFQRAEAERAWKVICEKNESNEDFQKDLKEFNKLVEEVKNKAAPNQDKQISKWAKMMAQKYGNELSTEMKAFKMDFKHTVPQDFVDYFQKNGILKSEFDINPPS